MIKNLFLIAILFLFTNSLILAASGVVLVYEPDRMDGLTSSGEKFNAKNLSCAHSTLPFGTKVVFTNGDKVCSNVVVNDRIDEDEDIFYVTHEVFNQLSDGDVGVANINYTIIDLGDNNDYWGERGNLWFSAENVKSHNIFDTFYKLVKKGYKVKVNENNESLDIMYIVSHRWEYLMSELSNLGVNTSEIIKKEMEVNPLRR